VLAHESPELLARVEVVWMGATLGRGNVTAQAEFNAYADPRALRVVLEHGARLRVIGLDVTTRVAVREEELADAPRGGARAAVIDAALRSLCQVERKYFGRGLAILHDPCAIAAAFAPGLFSFRKLALEVTEREGPERGRVRAAGPGAVDYAVEVRADELAAEFLARVSAWAER